MNLMLSHKVIWYIMFYFINVRKWENISSALMRKAAVFNCSPLTGDMTDVLHTYHNSQEYTKVLMKFLKVDGIHEEHHRLFSILYSWKYIMSAVGPPDSTNLRSKIFGGKKFQKVPKSKSCICLLTGNYLHSIYIVLGIISNVETV